MQVVCARLRNWEYGEFDVWRCIFITGLTHTVLPCIQFCLAFRYKFVTVMFVVNVVSFSCYICQSAGLPWTVDEGRTPSHQSVLLWEINCSFSMLLILLKLSILNQKLISDQTGALSTHIWEVTDTNKYGLGVEGGNLWNKFRKFCDFFVSSGGWIRGHICWQIEISTINPASLYS